MIANPSLAGNAVHRRVEHSDIDAFGVVHCSRYAAFAETAVLARLEQLGFGLNDLETAGVELRVRQLRLHYRTAARYRDELLLTAEIKHVGMAHLRMTVRICRTDAEPVVVAEGEVELVFVALDTEKLLSVPQPLQTLGGLT